MKNLTDKDITLFTFTIDDEVNRTMLYKICEESWKKVLPNAKIVKFDFNELKKQYSEVWFNKYIHSCKYVTNNWNTDFLRIIKAIEIPNSIYLDSDILFKESPLDEINTADSFIGSQDCFYNNGKSEQIMKLYDFYTGNHTNETKQKISEAINGNDLFPELYDAKVWEIIGLKRSYLGKRHHYYVFAKSRYIIIKDATIDDCDWIENMIDSFDRTIVFNSKKTKVWCEVIGDYVYRTPDIDFFKKVAIDFCKARKKETEFYELNLDEIDTCPYLSEDDKKMIRKFSKKY